MLCGFRETEYGSIYETMVAKVSSSDCRAMKEVSAKLGSEWLGGMVVYRGAEIKKLGVPKLWAVPSFRLFTW
jgi:hypothetical protein